MNALELVATCSDCGLAKTRRCQTKVASSVEANPDILFITDPPSDSSEVREFSVNGLEVKLIKGLLRSAAELVDAHEPSFACVGSLLCVPRDESILAPRVPLKAELLACRKNLLPIAEVLKPKAIVLSGDIAKRYYQREFPWSSTIPALATLVRTGGPSGPWYGVTLRSLSEVIKELEKEKNA